MKRWMLGAAVGLALVAVAPAWANEWFQAANAADGTVFYLHPERWTRKENRSVDLWFKAVHLDDPKAVNLIAEEMVEVRFRCSDRQSQILGGVAYDGKGRVLRTYPPTPASRVVPDSVLEVLMGTACSAAYGGYTLMQDSPATPTRPSGRSLAR